MAKDLTFYSAKREFLPSWIICEDHVQHVQAIWVERAILYAGQTKECRFARLVLPREAAQAFFNPRGEVMTMACNRIHASYINRARAIYASKQTVYSHEVDPIDDEMYDSLSRFTISVRECGGMV